MIRKSIFEMRDSGEYDIQNEFDIISNLFNENILIWHNNDQYDFIDEYNTTIEQAIDVNCFCSWKQRGHSLNINDFKEKIGLYNTNTSDEIGIITFLEYFSNMIYLVDVKLSSSVFCHTNKYELLKGNIDILLEHLNYEKHVFEEEEKVLLIPKNPMATSVAEISDEYTANAIFQYHHESLKGNLEAKSDILRRIATKYELLLNNPKNSNFKKYCDTAMNALNNLYIRHNNEKKDFFRNLREEDKKELEKQYDNLYEMILFCIQGQEKLIPAEHELSEFLKKVNQTEKTKE